MEPQDESIAMREMMRTEGWEILKGDTEDMILADTERLATLDIEKSTGEVGAEYIALRKRIEGMRDVLAIAEKHHG